MRDEAEQAIGSVVEGSCPLCRAELRIHDGFACCVCCGDAYKVETDRMEVRQCPQHAQNCEHWREMWSRLLP